MFSIFFEVRVVPFYNLFKDFTFPSELYRVFRLILFNFSELLLF